MEQKQIIAGNRLIAIFDGKRQDEDSPWWREFDVEIYGSRSFHNDEMKYDSLWEWLMPIVERIEEIGYEVTITRTSCSIYPVDEGQYGVDIGYKIGSVWQAVVDFIIWYNERYNKPTLTPLPTE